MSNTKWYAYRPVDTLYFRDARPMMIGEHHTAGLIFPPMPQTIVGALRTYLCRQKGFEDVDLNERIGAPGEVARFEILGPLFEEKGKYFVPLPYFCFVEKEDLKKTSDQAEPFELSVSTGAPLQEILGDGIKSIRSPHRDRLFWTKGRNLVSLGDLYWIQAEDFKKLQIGASVTLKIYPAGYFYSMESRVGIARNPERTVREGCLYRFTHVRLKESVRLVFGVSKDIGLPESFLLQLGAEQRFGKAKLLKNFIPDLSGEGTYRVLLGAVPYTQDLHVVATGKLKRVGGWDMKKKFHKEMKSFLPAGTVVTAASVVQNFVAIF